MPWTPSSRPARFLSTLSLRRATWLFQPKHEHHNPFLSTLSLRRATRWVRSRRRRSANFYPRSPCGERHNVRPDTRRPCAISIHALLAESDNCHNKRPVCRLISIHALLAESDLTVCQDVRQGFIISIHALLAESDLRIKRSQRRAITNFYPRSPCGERPMSNVWDAK